jgi:hypothetical protein
MFPFSRLQHWNLIQRRLVWLTGSSQGWSNLTTFLARQCEIVLVRSAARLSASVVQDNVEQRAMNFQALGLLTAVLDKTHLAKPVHEKADSRAGGTDNLR